MFAKEGKRGLFVLDLYNLKGIFCQVVQSFIQPSTILLKPSDYDE
jgi:hypothetical protein